MAPIQSEAGSRLLARPSRFCPSYGQRRCLCIPASGRTIGVGVFACCPILSVCTFQPNSTLCLVGTESSECGQLPLIWIIRLVERIGWCCFCDCRRLASVTSEPRLQLSRMCSYPFNRCVSLGQLAFPLPAHVQ
jgi:hypothetical protein